MSDAYITRQTLFCWTHCDPLVYLKFGQRVIISIDSIVPESVFIKQFVWLPKAYATSYLLSLRLGVSKDN
jgi:hypothetical protein